ncbi:hypothetical protein GCM10007385_46120 [Tateyamaria omphalii]|uniref:MSMEG_0570 family nitrogen starvation response protein n=1 Tax=Tateyamaria omphalii TaxID=299262 RepID=UPI0016798025|nr:MSMEG_0570 family nitrogen starvation response protein [Tateyamaria omphalii]GGX72087.1 hypothetical protein GCM10007385_46120 [Tateyamaria omphalii]
MPETLFTVRWPNGEVDTCYSPSTVVRDFLTAGTTYPVADFVDLCSTALDTASLRVAAKFGHRCSNADAQLAQIETKAKGFSSSAGVTCLSMT